MHVVKRSSGLCVCQQSDLDKSCDWVIAMCIVHNIGIAGHILQLYVYAYEMDVCVCVRVKYECT